MPEDPINKKVLDANQLLQQLGLSQRQPVINAAPEQATQEPIKNPWGTDLGNINLDDMFADETPEQPKVGLLKSINLDLTKGIVDIAKAATEVPQLAEGISNLPYNLIGNAIINRQVKRGELKPDEGEQQKSYLKEFSPKSNFGQTLLTPPGMETIGEQMAESGVNKWLENQSALLEKENNRYDKEFKEYWKEGDYGNALGVTVSMIAESLPATLVAAFAGPAGAAMLGITTGAQTYDAVKDRDDMEESAKVIDAVSTGIFEWLFEWMGTAQMAKILEKSYVKFGADKAEDLFKQNALNVISKAYKKFGVWFAPVHEGLSEILTTIGQNYTAQLTGEDPNRKPWDNAIESFLAGFGIGTVFAGTTKGMEALSNKLNKQDLRPPPGDTSTQLGLPFSTVDIGTPIDQGGNSLDIGPLAVPTDQVQQDEVIAPQTPEEMDMEVEKHFQPLKENMEQFRNRETGDLDMFQDQRGQMFYMIEQIDDDAAVFISAETVEGEPAQKMIKGLLIMQKVQTLPYAEWEKGVRDNLRMGIDETAQTQEIEAAKPDPTAENSYKEEVEALAANPEAQPEDIQAIRDRVTDDMVNGVQFSDEFLQQLEITKPEVPAEIEASPVVEPKSFPVTIEDKKNVIQTKAIEQPNGSYLLEQTFPAFEEAEKAQVALTKKYGHKGYQVKIESKSMDETNPFAEDIHSVRIITKPVSVVSPEKTVVTKETVQEGEENKRVQAAIDKASKPKKGWPMSNADKEFIAQDPASFSMAVYQFFLRGGRVKTSDLNDYLGKEITASGGNPYIWAIANDGISLDVINQLPEFEQFMTGMTGPMDGINAFMDVLKGVGSKQDIREKLNTMLGNQDAPAPTDEELAEQQSIDADETIAELSETIEVNPKILPIFMEYLDLDGNIEWDKLATQAEKDPFWFTEFPFNLTQAEFDELSNILTDDTKKRSIEEWYKANGITEIKAERDELFPRGEQPESGVGSQVDQGQPAISETQAEQPAAEVIPPDEEPPAEILPETPAQPEIAGKFPHFPEGTRIMRTDGTGPKKIFYDGLTLGGAFVMLREGDPQSDKVFYLSPDEFEQQFVKYEKAAPVEVTPEPKVNSDEAIQKARDIVAEISSLEKPEALLSELTLPKEVFGFFNSLRKSDVSRDVWAVYGKGFTAFGGSKINSFFTRVNNAVNGAYGHAMTQDQEILKDQKFDISLVEKADHDRIWFKNGVVLIRVTGSNVSNANFFYAGTQVSLRDVPYVEIMKMVEAGELTEDKANEIIESKQEPQFAGDLLKPTLSKDDETIQQAQSDFDKMIKGSTQEDLEKAKAGSGLAAAKFAMRYTTPDKNQTLYNKIYDIYFNHFTSKEAVDKPVDNLTEKEQQLAQEEAKVDTEPTEAEIKAGNYQKGHISIQGMDISIENPKGSILKGTDQNGKQWEMVMNNTYGYFRGTIGRDKDHVDVFLGDNLDAPNVYIIDQINPETGKYDEAKIMLGFDNAVNAHIAYHKNYQADWKGYGAMTEMPVETFKKWLYNGKPKNTPLAYEKESIPEVKLVKDFTTDTGNFSVYDISPEHLDRADMFTVLKDKAGYIVRHVLIPEELRRKGIASRFYQQMNEESIKETGNPLRSTRPRTLLSGEAVHELSPDAIALWDSFVSKGIAVKNSEKDYSFNKPEDIYSNIRPKLDDIPYQLAYNAYRNMSFSPEKRAESEQKEYFDQVNAVIDEMDKIAKSPEQKAILIPEIERYKKGLIDKTNAYLSASSRTASPMITGPANFPVDRNRKAMNTLDKRRTELLEWDKKAQAAIKKAISTARTPEQYKSDKWNSIKDVLDDKIATIVSIDTGENTYTMRNLVVSNLKGFIDRIAKNGQVDDTRQVLDYVKEVQSKLTKPIFTDRNAVWNNVSVAEEMQKRKQKLSTIIPAYSQTGATGEYLVQKHSKSGEELHTIRLTEQVSPDEFKKLKELATRLGGHWSSYRKEGMLPGFIFKSKENADRFKIYLDNDMVSEPDMVYEDLFGNRTPIQSRMSFDFQPQPETEAKTEKVKPEVKKTVKTRKPAGEFSLVEVKSRIDGGMFFNGSVTITSPQDVAFLLRNLQTASVENVIIVGIKQDGTPLIYHHSTGSTAGTVVEPTQVARFLHENDFKESYMVHNHPSGNPSPSPSDYKIADVLRKTEESGGKKITFIINDVDTGIFTIFNPITSTHEEFQELSEKDYIEKGIETKDYEVLKFDRIAFTQDAEFLKPAKGISEERPGGRIVPKIKQSKNVAEFISAMRFSTGKKLGALILDRSNAIVANYFIPLEWDSDKMFYELSGMIGRHNGQGVIFYDNNFVKPEGKSATEIKINEVFNKADNKSPRNTGHVFSVFDYISAPISPDINVRYSEQYISRADQGVMEPETSYKPKSILDLENRIKDTENRIIETVKQKESKKNELSKRINVQTDMFAGDILKPKVEQGSMFDVAQDASQDNIQRILQPFDNTLARLRDELKGLKNQLTTATREISGQQDMFEGVSEPSATMWPEVVNGFYSPIEKRLAEFRQEQASVNKWKEIIGKGDEAEFTGVLGYLNSLKPDQQLRKSELSQWMKDNRIEIKEVVKGELRDIEDKPIIDVALEEFNVSDEDHFTESDVLGIDDDAEGGWTVEFNKENSDGYTQIHIDKENYPALSVIDETKFSQYQIPGEKSDYKEVLVTMPKDQEVLKAYKEKDDYVNYLENKYKNKPNLFQTDVWEVTGTPEEIEKLKDLVNKANEVDTNFPTFKSTHFHEPNILVHLRMNTRTDSEGKKVLFLEEIQSDWGQKGKKEGFATGTENYDKLIGEFNERMSDKYNLKNYDPYQRVPMRDKLMNNEEKAELERIGNLRIKHNQIAGVPQAPFISDTNAWVKLAFKVAMKEAVAQDADKIAWTTGEQQNDRYDLSKQVGSVLWTRWPNAGEGMGVLSAFKDGNEVIKETIHETKVEDYIGKDIAKRLLESEEDKITGVRSLTGENLKVGGKGMVGFYGSPSENKPGIIGNIARSLTKQEPKTINLTIPRYNIRLKNNGFYEVNDIDGNMVMNNVDPEKIDQWKQTDTIQNSIDITPEIKADIQKGLPMFMKSAESTLTEADKEHIDFIKGIIDDLQSRAPNASKVVIIPTIDDLPEFLFKSGIHNKELLKAIASAVVASDSWAFRVTDNDTVYFIAEKTKHDKDHIIETWLHEQIGHKGIKLLYPNEAERDKYLKELYDAIGPEEITRVLHDWYDSDTNERKAEEYLSFLSGKVIDGEKLTPKEKTIWQKVLDYFKNLWQKLTGKEVTDYDLARVIHAMLTKVMAPAETKAKTIEEAVSLKLYHGTGHDFNSFSTDRVNSGMNAMYNGWGLYFTDKQGIAQYYASQVASQSIYFKQALKDLGENASTLDKALYYSGGSNTGVTDWLQDKLNTFSDDAKIAGKYKAILQYLETNPLPELRHIYIISLHNGRTPGDWDYIDLFKTVSTDQINKINKTLSAEEGQEINRMTGRMIYKKLSDILGGDRLASEFLLRANIDGLKYESSKIYDKTEGTSYVVFDDSQITIDQHIAFMKAKKDDKMINSRTQRFLELFTQRMQSVVNIQKLIAKRGGKITDDTNVIMTENLAASSARAQIENYQRDTFGPLLETVGDILDKTEKTYGKTVVEKFDEYLRAKHSPERNKFMEEETGREQNADFATEDAELIIEQYEALLTPEEITALWEGINKATEFTLKKYVETGFMDKEGYKRVKNMGYTHYVPLRGWKETFNDIFDYQESGRSGTAYQGLIKAKGRSSESAFVLAYIQSMANTAIVAGEKNRVKQAAYEMVWENKAMKDLFRIMVVYTVDTGDLDADGKAITYETVTRPAKELWDEGKVSISKSHSHEIRRPAAMSKQHEVHLFLNGQKVVLVFTDPSVANAINHENQWEPELTRWLQKYPGKVSRWMSANFTAKNPAFMPINQIRDLGYAIASHSIKYGTAPQFLGNLYRARKTIIRATRGKADLVNNSEDKLYEQWRTYGGETGYVHLDDIKNMEKDVIKQLNRVIDKNSLWDKTMQTWLLKNGGQLLENLAKRSENLSRYATFLTSLENGRSVKQSVYDGKEITVNFNTKGGIGAALGTLYLFFNANVQGGVNMVKLGKNGAKKFALISAGFMALGYLSALLANLWSDDDENGDSYYDALGDWVKHNNLVIPTGGRGFITIPMPFGFRTFFAWGVLGHEWLNGKKSAMDAVLLGTDSVFESVSPVSPSGFYNSEEQLTSRPLWPGFTLPIYDIAVNEDFAGRRLYQQPFTTEMEKTLASSQQGLEYVSPYIKGVTDYLYKKGGGDMEIKRKKYVDSDGQIRKIPDMMDWNPSKIEHFFESYLGGRFQFWNQAVTTSTEIIKGSVKAMQTGELKDIVDGVQLNTVPVLRRLYQQPWAKPYWGKYFEYREEIETYIGLKKAYEGKLNIEKWNIMEGQKNMQEKVQIFEGSNDLIKDLFKMAGAEELTKEARMELLNQRDKLVQELVKKLSAKDSINNIPK